MWESLRSAHSLERDGMIHEGGRRHRRDRQAIDTRYFQVTRALHLSPNLERRTHELRSVHGVQKASRDRSV